MEAMATGLPVIATNVGCIEDLIIDGKEGHLINNKADYNKIPTLIKDKKLQKKFSINAKEKIKQFEWKTVKDKYLKLYE
jgi:spore coat protein SA